MRSGKGKRVLAFDHLFLIELQAHLYIEPVIVYALPLFKG
jgi:hypothetical protein